MSKKGRCAQSHNVVDGAEQSFPLNVCTDTKAVKSRVSNRDFVLAYKANSNYPDLAKAVGMTVNSVKVRCAKLRKAGVNLVKYDRPKHTVDIGELNSLL